jgi:hypothetical protein
MNNNQYEATREKSDPDPAGDAGSIEALRAALGALEAERDRWHAHYDAAMIMWKQVESERDQLKAQIAALLERSRQ